MSTTLHALQAAHDVHAAASVKAAGGMQNPFSGIVPDFSVLGADFNSKWKKLFAAYWFGCLVLGGAYVLRGFVSMNQHKGSNHPHELQQSRSDLVKAIQAFAGLVAFNTLIGAIIFAIS